MTTFDTPHRQRFVIPSEWEFEASIHELRPTLEDPSCIRQWWGRVFMHIEELCPGDAGGKGQTLKCYTKGFLPYALQFVARIDTCQANKVVFTMQGDFDGQATICAEEKDGVTRVLVIWVFNLRHPRLRPFAAFLRPLYIWNHRWAMRQGHRGLQHMLNNRRNRDAKLTYGHPTFPHNIAAMQVPGKWRV